MTIVQEYLEFMKKFEASKKEYLDKMRGSFHQEVFAETFAKVPSLKQIQWEQYTPYFNDGDECVFSVRDRVYSSSDTRYNSSYRLEELDKDETGEPEAGAWSIDGYSGFKIPDDTDSSWIKERYESHLQHVTKEEYAALHDLETILSQLPKELYRDYFGEHSTVRVTRDSIETEEYEHD